MFVMAEIVSPCIALMTLESKRRRPRIFCFINLGQALITMMSASLGQVKLVIWGFKNCFLLHSVFKEEKVSTLSGLPRLFSALHFFGMHF